MINIFNLCNDSMCYNVIDKCKFDHVWFRFSENMTSTGIVQHTSYWFKFSAFRMTKSRTPIPGFFHPDLFFFGPSGWLGLIMNNPVKSCFFKINFWQLINLIE